jgi:hypothetical protein
MRLCQGIFQVSKSESFTLAKSLASGQLWNITVDQKLDGAKRQPDRAGETKSYRQLQSHEWCSSETY